MLFLKKVLVQEFQFGACLPQFPIHGQACKSVILKVFLGGDDFISGGLEKNWAIPFWRLALGGVEMSVYACAVA